MSTKHSGQLKGKCGSRRPFQKTSEYSALCLFSSWSLKGAFASSALVNQLSRGLQTHHKERRRIDFSSISPFVLPPCSLPPEKGDFLTWYLVGKNGEWDKGRKRNKNRNTRRNEEIGSEKESVEESKKETGAEKGEWQINWHNERL